MGIFDIFKKIETPDTKAVITEAKKLKLEFKKTDVNTIPVRYFFKNSPYFKETIATLYRMTNFTVGIMDIPEPLGFIVADDTIYFDKDTKKEVIHIKEGYPFSINLESELNREAVIKIKSEFDAFKEFNPKVKEYIVPLMINQIPLKAVRVKLGNILPGFSDEMDITQKFIQQIFFVKILQKVNKEKIQGSFMLVLMGFLAGALFALAATMFFLK